MTCELDRDRLDAYVDESLPPEELAAMEAHLRDCPSCASEAIARMQLKRATRAAGASLALSPEFRMRPEFRSALQAQMQKRSQPLWKSARLQWLAAAALALSVVAVSSTVIARYVARTQAIAELVDMHVATTASANPVDVISTDRHTVKPWFQGKLPFTFNLPELQDSPYKLLGGKLVYFEHNPGAQLLFELRKHQISVFILQDQGNTAALDARVSAKTEKGFSMETWSQAGLRYVIVGDTGASNLHALGDLLRGANR
ncbi:MAG: zf-HC2 domain-containing protein [Terracidiphilus sp.]